jgi:hypothetical protein
MSKKNTTRVWFIFFLILFFFTQTYHREKVDAQDLSFSLSSESSITPSASFQPSVNEIIVTYRNEIHSKENVRQILTESVQDTVALTQKSELITLYHTKNLNQIIESIKKDPNVLYVDRNAIRQPQVYPNDPYYSNQWYLNHIRAVNAWSNINQIKKQTVVAVLDTGISSLHPELESRIDQRGFNFTTNDRKIEDVNGHGTFVSGIIAARTNNEIGIAGTVGEFPVKVLPMKVCSNEGCFTSDLIRAIDYAIRLNVDVINISLGGSEFIASEYQSIQEAIDAGITVVAAAGNQSSSDITYPGGYSRVISVGSVSSGNRRSRFSNYNETVSVVAPGENIKSIYLGNGYNTMSGTSFSTPIVSSMIAILKGINPELTPSQLKKMIEETATDLGPEGKDIEYGYGVVSFDKVVSLVTSSQTEVIGNTSGNLNHLGEWAESEEWIFFSNKDDQGKLYKMRKDRTDFQRLNDDVPASINVAEGQVYYANQSDAGRIYKIDFNGGNRIMLNEDSSQFVTVMNKMIFYSNASDDDNLYMVYTNGNSRKKLNDDASYYLYAKKGWIYYQNRSDQFRLYRMRPDGTAKMKLSNDASWYTNITDENIFYQNDSDKGNIYKMTLDGSSRVKVIQNNAWFLNINKGWIYYHNQDDNGYLYKVRVNGTDKTRLNQDFSTLIHVVGEWIYYFNENDQKQLYQIRLDGTERQKVIFSNI